MTKKLSDTTKCINKLRPFLNAKIKYIAMDVDKIWWGYQYKPTKAGVLLVWETNRGDSVRLTSMLDIPIVDNWRESLVKIK